MKLVIAIVQDKDSTLLANALVENNIRSTKLASSGGFLKSGNTTFLMGVDDEVVDNVLKVIDENCSKREEIIMQQSLMSVGLDNILAQPLNVVVGGATVFVLPIDQFLQF